MIVKEFPISDQAGLYRRCAAQNKQIAKYVNFRIVCAAVSSSFWNRLVSPVCSSWAPGNTSVQDKQCCNQVYLLRTGKIILRGRG